MMICPECGRELEKGIIEAKDACMKVFASFEKNKVDNPVRLY